MQLYAYYTRDDVLTLNTIHTSEHESMKAELWNHFMGTKPALKIEKYTKPQLRAAYMRIRRGGSVVPVTLEKLEND